jgi:hypothetical protein
MEFNAFIFEKNKWLYRFKTLIGIRFEQKNRGCRAIFMISFIWVTTEAKFSVTRRKKLLQY